MKNTERSSKVGIRIHRYLFKKNNARKNTYLFIQQLSKSLPETVVFGGMIRDFSLTSGRNFNSDIDLVSMADRESILSAIRCYNPVHNKFGGFRFAVGRQLFDIWSYQDTWAFRERLVTPTSIEDLCSTTFFNMDAAYQPLKSKKIICSPKYIESLESQTLDINLEENPAPEKIAARAIYMSINKDLKVSPRLQAYILKNAKNSLWRSHASYLRHMAKHRENHEDLNFYYRPQVDLFSD
ncbi:MAG: hypothetical protein ACXV8O_02605 [Methylobacter sp.]